MTLSAKGLKETTRSATIFVCVLTQAFNSLCFLFSLRKKGKTFKSSIQNPINTTNLINLGATLVLKSNKQTNQWI